MDAQITLSVDHAKVLSARPGDEARVAELSAELVTENQGEQVLVAAPENTRFELHDDRGTLLEVLHVRSASAPGNPAHQLDPGQKVHARYALDVQRTAVQPGTPYKLVCHSHGLTKSVDFRFL